MKSDRPINPLGNLYTSFMEILNNMTIKYSYKAEQYETVETKMAGDGYIDSVNQRDTFFSYIDYTETELKNAGIYDGNLIESVLKGNIRNVPRRYQDSLLQQRRARCIHNFEEKNNYYRMLNGYPDVEDEDYIYIPSYLAEEYEIDKKVPLHKIQDTYNNKESGLGDYFMSMLEGFGFIDKMQKLHPDKKYLNYLGSNRIPIVKARMAYNFQIIQLKKGDVKDVLIDEFIRIYEASREYFVSTIYIHQYGTFFEKYDNFIAMCIMLMTTQQLVMRQLSSYINRNFFDINAVKALYEAYDVPFDLSIDEDTQNLLVKNLNMLIKNKATDKIIYDISYMLGFTNIKVYKYLLAKERKYDKYGVPIVKWTTKFNHDTGEVENVLDKEAMYDLYFQRSELREKDISNSFKDISNHVKYEDVTSNDPFWIEDQNLYERVWEPEYNYVESKYLSLGVSYKMTYVMFENVLFLKLLMQKGDDIKDLTIKIPKILGYREIPIFDVIIALVCLTACKHNIYGEIISIPTQVVSVLDYIKSKEQYDLNLDTLKFNFNYFFNPDVEDQNSQMDEFKDQLSKHMRKLNKKGLIEDTFQFNFDYFDKSKPDTQEKLDKIRFAMGESDYIKFREYVDIIQQDVSNAQNKAKAINDIYNNIYSLRTLLNYYMTKICDNRREYENIKQLYDALFYSQEISELFTITGEVTGTKRTAFTYFEYLYHRNPMLYNALFEIDMDDEYAKYVTEHHKSTDEYSYDDFIKDVEYGNIFIDYSSFIGEKEAEENGDRDYKKNKLYYFINHIIGRMQLVIDNVNFLYMMNDATTPLADLLLKLVRFFKSYTVDVIGMDVLFIYNQKPENCLRLFDEIYELQKIIQTNENLHLSYGDAIHLIESTIKIGKTENVKLSDKFIYDALLYITRYDSIYKEHPELLSINLSDKVNIGDKEIELVENDIQKLYDTMSLTSELQTDDSVKLKDRIVKMWYSD